MAGCQLPDVGHDSAQALALIESNAWWAAAKGASLVCFPEGFLQGYTLEPQRIAADAIEIGSREFGTVLRRLAYIDTTLVFGFIERQANRFFNSAAAVRGGALLGVYRKKHLLAGERRVFQRGTDTTVVEVAALKVGINICYDLNFADAAASAALAGAALIACPCNNMMPRANAESWKARHNEIRQVRARESGVWLLSSDVAGERNGRIGYGPTAVIDPSGTVLDQVPPMTTGIVFAEVAAA